MSPLLLPLPQYNFRKHTIYFTTMSEHHRQVLSILLATMSYKILRLKIPEGTTLHGKSNNMHIY